MLARRPMDAQAVGLMVLLCATWGLQPVALKAIALQVPPVLQLGLRSGVAALLVGCLMLLRREAISWRSGNWRPGLVVGALFASEFLLVGEGLKYTTASHMVIFLYTAPIFAALGLHLRLPHERLSLAQWLGIAVAFAGVVLAFSARLTQQSSELPLQWFGDALGLLGAIAWGATTVTVRCSRLATAKAGETLLYQLLGAFVLLLGVAAVTGQVHFEPSPLVWASLGFQAVIVSFASFLTWFWLLGRYLASRIGVLSFMTPLFGVVFGVLLLNEPLETPFLLGGGLVLSGIALVSGHDLLRLWAAKRAA